MKFFLFMGLFWAGVGCALFYWVFLAGRGPCRIKTLVKTGALGLPALGLTIVGWPLLALAGLWASVLGDYMLSRPGQKALLMGIGAFAGAHGFYIAHFVWGLGLDPVPDTETWIAIGGLLLLGLSTEGWLTPKTGELKSAVRAYVALILTMGVCAILLGPHGFAATLGAMLFIASDAVLALELFVLKETSPLRRLTPRVVWPLYVLGQFGIQVAGM
ncbi:MAG: lysoplasmalogenase [Brevirhabdus sp.]